MKAARFHVRNNKNLRIGQNRFTLKLHDNDDSGFLSLKPCALQSVLATLHSSGVLYLADVSKSVRNTIVRMSRVSQHALDITAKVCVFFVCHRYFKMCTADMTGFFVCFFNPRVSHKMFKKLQVFVSDRSLIQYATDTAVKQCFGSRMCLALRAADIIKQYLLSHIYFTKYSTDIIIRERFDFHNACDRYYNKRPFCVSKFFFTTCATDVIKECFVSYNTYVLQPLHEMCCVFHRCLTTCATHVITEQRFVSHDACCKHYNKRSFCVSQVSYNVCDRCNQRVFCFS